MVAREQLAGVVVSAGKMMKTVKVRMVKQTWHRHLRKNYSTPYNVLVHDGQGSIIEGDVITLRPERHSRRVFYAAEQILAPFGSPVDERPPLITKAEQDAIWAAQKEAKEARKLERLQQGVVAGQPGAQRLVDDGGEGPGKGVDGKGREVLPGGDHKFGSINEEAIAGKRKVLRKQDQGMRHERSRERMADKSAEKIQQQALSR